MRERDVRIQMKEKFEQSPTDWPSVPLHKWLLQTNNWARFLSALVPFERSARMAVGKTWYMALQIIVRTFPKNWKVFCHSDLAKL